MVGDHRMVSRGPCWEHYGIPHNDGHYRIRRDYGNPVCSPAGSSLGDGTWVTRDSHLAEVRCDALHGGYILLAESDCFEMTDASYMVSYEAGHSPTPGRT